MIIAGAGSAGKEALGISIAKQEDNGLIFFDENPYSADNIFGKYQIIKTLSELKSRLSLNPEFCVAIGNPRKRKKLFDLMIENGGTPKNLVYPRTATISNFLENGTIIQPNVVFSYDVEFGKSCLFHANSTIGHKVKIGDYVNISPLCAIIGPCQIGNETYIGAGSIILPEIFIGNNVYIKSGSIVDRDLSDFETF